jgi:hypothetical protein
MSNIVGRVFLREVQSADSYFALRAPRVNGNRKLISCRQSKIDQLGFIGRRP